MKATVMALAGIVVLDALLAVWTPWEAELLARLGVVLGITAGVLLLFWAAARLLSQRRSSRSAEPAPVAAPRTGFLTPRPMAATAVALAAEYLWISASLHLRSLAVAEIGYYSILLALGVVLSRWCRARSYVPLLASAAVLLALAVIDVIAFMNNPAARFQYGPEIVIFAASNFAARLSMLPLDASAAWIAWRAAEGAGRSSRSATREV